MTEQASPRQRILAYVNENGVEDFVRGCIELLERPGGNPRLLAVLGGRHSETVLSGREGGLDGAWPRVWAARGLLHQWSNEAEASITLAISDPAWRVREMALKVVASHQVVQAFDEVVKARADETLRVRVAAERALEKLVESEN